MRTKLIVRKNGTDVVLMFNSNVDAVEMCAKLYDALLDGEGEGFELTITPDEDD